MRYRYKFKTVEKQEYNTEKKTGISKRSRMLLLLMWSTLSVGLYLAFSKTFALVTTQIIEVLLFSGLVVYWVCALRVRKIIKVKGEDADEIPKLVQIGQYCLILVLPLVFILIYDFILTSVKSFVM